MEKFDDVNGAVSMVTSPAPRGASGSRPLSANSSVEDKDLRTRERVVDIILHEGPQTASELAKALDLTPAAVRRHLGALLDSGVLESQDQKVRGHRGRGRPAQVFCLTEQGRSQFYQAYDQLAIDALGIIAEAFGDEAIDQLAEKRLHRVEEIYRRRRAEGEDDPIQALADALTEAGFATTVQPAVRGDQLCQHHCPVALVAEKFPQICEAENKVISRLLGSHVQRLATIAHGDGMCTLHIPDGPVALETPTVRASVKNPPRTSG